jgi:hypothetical protein
MSISFQILVSVLYSLSWIDLTPPFYFTDFHPIPLPFSFLSPFYYSLRNSLLPNTTYPTSFHLLAGGRDQAIFHPPKSPPHPKTLS